MPGRVPADYPSTQPRFTERRKPGQVVVGSFAAMMRGRVFPVTSDDVLAAGQRAKGRHGPRTRYLLRLAVMRRLGRVTRAEWAIRIIVP